MIPLSKMQKEIMSEFYNLNPTKVIFDKKQRNELWKKTRSKQFIDNIDEINRICPALAHQINKSYSTGNHIQSAVFSECVYAQTFANMFNLEKFVNCAENNNFLPKNILKLLDSYFLYPRYVYHNEKQNRMLIQAGGCNGIDSALITVVDLNIYTIEFKEPKAKTSEPDLPKYKENGRLLITKEFINRYPQFEAMLREHKKLNFFKLMGNNEHRFSDESINIAVSNNYAKKYADVICTEDVNGFLVMIPANQASVWAKTEGEIRPAGRNAYKVWTPKALKRFLSSLDAKICNGYAEVKKESLKLRLKRGGDSEKSGYKINPLFFIRSEHCQETGDFVKFCIDDVEQLNPTVAGKMFFDSLDYKEVEKYYFE